MRNFAKFLVLFVVIAMAAIPALTMAQGVSNQDQKKKVLEYQVEFVPNPDVVVIHVNQKLTNQIVEYTPNNPLIKALLDIRGVADSETHVYRYSFSVNRARLFKWEVLLPQIIAVLQSQFPGYKLVEQKMLPVTKQTPAVVRSTKKT